MKKAEERRTHTSHFLPGRRTIQGGVSIFGRVAALAKAARLGRSWRGPVTAYCVSVPPKRSIEESYHVRK